MPQRRSKKRLINCHQVDVNQLMPLKYEWAWEHYLNGCANHWMPTEVPMHKDIETWKVEQAQRRRAPRDPAEPRLLRDGREPRRRINPPGLAIFRHVTNAECRQYLLRQAFEEAVHTHTFLYVVESLGLNERRVFNMYHEVPAIAAQRRDGNGADAEVLEPRLHDRQLRERAGLPQKPDRLLYVIMEGIFFYTGFVMVLSFHRRNLMTGIGEQFQYILRDEAGPPQFRHRPDQRHPQREPAALDTRLQSRR